MNQEYQIKKDFIIKSFYAWLELGCMGHRSNSTILMEAVGNSHMFDLS